jgi:UDP-glucose 4-epimerase
MRRATGREIDAEHGPERLGDLQRSVLDPSLAERGLGWRSEVSLEDGLRETWQFFSTAGAEG